MSMNVTGAASMNIQSYQQMQKTAAAGKPYNQGEYLSGLNKRVNATVLAGAWNGKTAFGSTSPTVMVHPAMLQKMAGDPAVGAYYEEQINIYAEESQRIIAQHAASGTSTVTSMGMYIDENGEMSGYMEGVFEGGENPTKSAKELMDELEEKLKKKAEEAKVEAEKQAEKQAAKNASEESLLDSLWPTLSTAATGAAAATAPTTESPEAADSKPVAKSGE